MNQLVALNHAPVAIPAAVRSRRARRWMNHQQRDVIDYLHEENRVLREQLGPRRVRSPMLSAVDWRRKPRHSDAAY